MAENSRKWHEVVCPRCETVTVKRLDSTAVYCSVSCAKKGFQPRGPGRHTISIQRYKRTHKFLSQHRGPANHCEIGCLNGPFQWCNMTGKFDNLDDYVQLCTKCHHRFDRYFVAVLIGV